jgi:hypothetical protein
MFTDSERLSWRRKLLSRHVIVPSVTNVQCYLTTRLFDWMIVGFLTSSGKYVINNQDENIFNIVWRFFLLFAYFIYSHGRYNYQTGGGITITSLSLVTFCQDLNFKCHNLITCYQCYVLSNYHLVCLIDWLIVVFLSWRPVVNSWYISRKRTCSTIYKKSVKISKGQPEYVNRRTENTMATENR